MSGQPSGQPSGQGIEENAPVYETSNLIITPEDADASDIRSWVAFDHNMRVGANYLEAIVSDQTAVTTTGRPLGMNYLLDTKTQCNATDIEGGTSVERYTYIQNNHGGSLIDTVVNDVEIGFSANNLELGFTSSIDCQGVTLSTIDENGLNGFGTAWVATTEISNIGPCQFKDRINPVTNEICNESFENYSDSKYDNNFIYDNKKKKDPLESGFLTGIMLLGLYLVYCFMKKTK